MEKLDKWVFYLLVVLIGGLTLVTQISLLEDNEITQIDQRQLHIPDYYIEEADGVMYNEDGSLAYRITTDRFVHFPDDNSVLLDNPHVIQYLPGESPKLIWGDSGWMNGAGDEILFRDNVRIRQAPTNGVGGFSGDTSQFRVQLEGDEQS